MDLKLEDIIAAVSNQRNGALNETAQLYAMLEAAKREIAELKDKYEKAPSNNQ